MFRGLHEGHFIGWEGMLTYKELGGGGLLIKVHTKNSLLLLCVKWIEWTNLDIQKTTTKNNNI